MEAILGIHPYLIALMGALLGRYVPFVVLATISIVTAGFALFMFIATRDMEIISLLGLALVIQATFLNVPMWLMYNTRFLSLSLATKKDDE